MNYLRYLVAVLTAFTLIMSVVSSVNPNYFAGLNAFADHEDEQEEDDNNKISSESNDDHEDDNDEDKHGADEEHEEDENEHVQPMGNHSKVSLEVDDEAELEVEIEDGDLDDGTYDVIFACESPEISKEFADSLNVTEGHGEYEADLGLSNDTYTGCEVEVGDLSAAFPAFTVMPDEHDDENDLDEEDNEEHEDDNERQDSKSSSGSNRHDDEEDDDNNSGRGSSIKDTIEEKRKERKERIVSTMSGAEIHERHRSANPHSPGEYDPGWNYTLEADGTALQAADGESLMQEEDVTIDIDMSVWKSNRAIILLDVVGGTVEIENNDYTVRIGYALYSVQHDAMKVVALATDDDGNVFKLRLRGSAVDEADQFPMESGSIDLIFGGDIDQSNNRFEEWGLLTEGSVEAT